ncbi:unnamed protein product [Paramecium octaurelia]|uniref:Uncharacterized protein n=1 Tax=Paramecium octaurelia TaxID=43137 RepID=A0A8S1WZV4_PAROT|nr:unnamed protein product [Paramecium octaurelia]
MSQIVLVVGPLRSGKSSLIDALTYGQLHKEIYTQDIHFEVKLAKIAQHRVYEVQSIEWDGKPLGLIEFYSNLADLVLIVVNICGNDDQMNQVQELYLAISNSQNSKQQVALIGNWNGQTQRNQLLCQSLSRFAKLNEIKLYELDSINLINVQMEFHYIRNKYSIFDDIFNKNKSTILQIVSQVVTIFK